MPRQFCGAELPLLKDPEAALNNIIQKSPAFAAVLLQDGQVFSAQKADGSVEPGALLALFPTEEGNQPSLIEFHLAFLHPNDQSPFLILAQQLSSEVRLLLVFPSRTSLSTAEQYFQELSSQLAAPTCPQPPLPDLSGLRLRQADLDSAPSWQAELFAQSSEASHREPQGGETPDRNHSKLEQTRQAATKPYWFQVF